MIPRVTQATVQLSARAPIRMQSVEVSSDVAAHDHDFFEIFFVRSGCGEHFSDRGVSRLAMRCATLLAPGQSHAIRVREKMEGVNLYFLTEWLLGGHTSFVEHEWILHWILARSLFARRATDEPLEFRFAESAWAEIETELHALAQESSRANPSALFLHVAFLKLLVLLSRADVGDAGNLAPGSRGLPVRPEVWRVMETIEERVRSGAPVQLEPLARAIGMSRDHLARLFRRETGLTPMAYFQRRRLQVAANQLLRSNRSVTEIAYALGYTDSAHFSRTFRQHHAETPGFYRKRFTSPDATVAPA